jgi:flagellar protein FlaG
MGIETIKGAAAAYQGSVPAAEIKEENRPRVEQSANIETAESIAQTTTAPDAKPTGVDDRAATQQDQSRQNAQIKKAVEDINKKASNTEAIFGIHEATNRVMIKIVDKETKEVIKELPPEKTLDMIAKVWEMAGLLVDEKR